LLNAAIIGMGKYADRLVSAIQGKSSRIRFAAGCTRDSSKGAAFAARHDLRLVSDYATVLADAGIDAVVIATPHSLHVSQVVQAAQAGKHVFVEKPFALTRESAEMACNACMSNGVKLAIGFNSRFSPALVELKKMVSSGVLGKILHLEGQISGYPGSAAGRDPGHWRTVRTENPAGGMTGKGIHLIDQMVWLCGSIESVYARSEKRVIDIEIDDVTTMLLKFKSGPSGYLGTILSTPYYWRLQVFGSNGWAEVRDEKILTFQRNGGGRESPVFESVDTRFLELEAFSDSINEVKSYPVTAEEAINGVAVLEAIDLSSQEKREVYLS